MSLLTSIFGRRNNPAQREDPAVRIKIVSAVATAKIESVTNLVIECLGSELFTFYNRPSRAVRQYRMKVFGNDSGGSTPEIGSGPPNHPKPPRSNS
jgi:hypothetical protein